ncbi:DUF4845 domain-containing protein [Acinetobacter sp. HY1485]|uniref:DUF4845 domain-containing protein n=1 Tax=Acinetobacter sp. HY1485 TaxID=2970918 RepID=UPI0022B996BE|nr:DUF4845 domain-containing protein [Acinetobacter sp. HY1485]
MSIINLIVGIFLFTLILKLSFSLIPAYWDNHIINKQLTELLAQNTSVSQLTQKMNERLEMNDIRDLKFEDIAKISNLQDQVKVSTHYEVRKHLLSNIDLVLTFEKNFDQRTIQVK